MPPSPILVPPSPVSALVASSASSTISTTSNTSTTSPIYTPPSPSPSPSLTKTANTTNTGNFNPSPPRFYFPIPFGTVTSETQPLLGYHRTTRTHTQSYMTMSNNPTVINVKPEPRSSIHSHSVLKLRARRRNNIRSVASQVQIACLTLLFIFACYMAYYTKLLEEDLSNSSDNNTSHPEGSMMSATGVDPEQMDTPQLRGIEFAVLCFVVFILSSIVRAVCYCMSRWGLCVGGEGSEMMEESFEDEEVSVGGYR